MNGDYEHDGKGPCLDCEWRHYCRKTGETCEHYRLYARLQAYKHKERLPDTARALTYRDRVQAALMAATGPMSTMQICAATGLIKNHVGPALDALRNDGIVVGTKTTADTAKKYRIKRAVAA